MLTSFTFSNLQLLRSFKRRFYESSNLQLLRSFKRRFYESSNLQLLRSFKRRFYESSNLQLLRSFSQENPSVSEDFVLQDYEVPFGAGSEHFGSQCICVEMYNAIIKPRPDWRLTKLMRGRGLTGSWSWLLSGWLCQCPGS